MMQVDAGPGWARRAAMVLGLLVGASATAAPVTWRLVGVRFADGGTATGSFVYESASDSSPAWTITVQGGGTGSFPPLTYTPSNSTYFGFQAPGEPGRRVTFNQIGSTRQLRITPIGQLTDAGGAFTLATNTPGGGVECFNCTPFRNVVAGSLIAEDASGDALRFGEILFDPPGVADTPAEFIELVGAPNATVGPGTYVVGVDGDGQLAGSVHTVFDLSGRTFGGNGRLVVLQAGSPHQVAAEATVVQGTGPGFAGLPGFAAAGGANGIANGSSTFLLVRAVTPPAPGDDLDTDNNGSVDFPAAASGWLVFDAVSSLDGGGGDISYAPVTFSPGAGVAPGGPVTPAAGQVGYLARFLDQPDDEAAAWVAAALTGELVAIRLGAVTPPCFIGTALSHIGAANPDCPVNVFIDGFEP